MLRVRETLFENRKLKFSKASIDEVLASGKNAKGDGDDFQKSKIEIFKSICRRSAGL